MILIRRLEPEVELNAHTVHRMFLICLELSIKFCEDFEYENVEFARYGGVDVAEFNRMEETALTLIKWKLCISEEEFNRAWSEVFPSNKKISL